MKVEKLKSIHRRVNCMTSAQLKKLMQNDRHCNFLKRIANFLNLDFKLSVDLPKKVWKSDHAYVTAEISVSVPHGLFYCVKIVSKHNHSFDFSRYFDINKQIRFSMLKIIEFRDGANRQLLMMTFSELAKTLLYQCFMDTVVYVPRDIIHVSPYDDDWKCAMDIDATTDDELELLLTLNGA